MPLFNRDKIYRLISEMRKVVTHLHDLQATEKDTFLNNPDKIGSTKYNFIVAIEAAIDICNHLISQNGYRAPEDYADTFQVLAEKGAFDSSFVKDLKEMGRFRNRLVHLYWEVDDEQIYEILQKRLNDFKTFQNNIAGFLTLEIS